MPRISGIWAFPVALVAFVSNPVDAEDLPAVPNPYGFDDRLALLTYFRDRGRDLPGDTSLTELWALYRDSVWPTYAALRQRAIDLHIAVNAGDGPKSLEGKLSAHEVRARLMTRYRLESLELVADADLPELELKLRRELDVRIEERNRELLTELARKDATIAELRAQVQRAQAHLERTAAGATTPVETRQAPQGDARKPADGSLRTRLAGITAGMFYAQVIAILGVGTQDYDTRDASGNRSSYTWRDRDGRASINFSDGKVSGVTYFPK